MSTFAWLSAFLWIFIASWFFYKYAAPKRFSEWSRAGLVQAFLIAFYAEMYGFPLTTYFLVRFFGIDSPALSSNLWINLFGTEAVMIITMMIGWIFFVFPGIAMVAEGWREIYHAKREGRLADDGLYGIVRHPQYTGIFLALFGESILHWPTLFSVLMFPVIVTAYALLARKEEKEMIVEYGNAYLDYKRRIPMFFPKGAAWKQILSGKIPRPGSRDLGRRGEEERKDVA